LSPAHVRKPKNFAGIRGVPFYLTRQTFSLSNWNVVFPNTL
jgi:hypothetical protein